LEETVEWFRKEKGAGPHVGKQRTTPDGQWVKCDACGEIVYGRELQKRNQVCPFCGHHFRIGSADIIKLLLDPDSFVEHDADLRSSDPLEFKDSKRYTDRIAATTKKSGLSDATVCGMGRISDREVSFAVMDFAFIGGSMGSVVGEKIARAIERAIENEAPLIVVSCSGGARMQEGILSLMQMAKTSLLLARLREKRIPFISVLTNPTTAGVMASYASLGDVILAEPKALLGFAGPRVIQQTIGQELPEGFQSTEFFLEHGFVDASVPRDKMRDAISTILDYLRAAKEKD
jgi:acetyl-CoA carboxylase carboxyl transferase subunit beta